MARKVRIGCEGAVYHVMARGNRREAIYRDDIDREVFLSLLGEACEKTGWFVHAYVLMGNHYHLMLETPEANLVSGMTWLQGTYTTRYNHRHHVVGHLFQGRYKAIVVEAEKGFFRKLAEYIHLNPPRVGMINNGASLESYPWSSYPYYLNRLSKRPSWLVADEVLLASGFADTANGRNKYRAWMEGKCLEATRPRARRNEDNEGLRKGWYLGDEGFRDYLVDWLEQNRKGRKRAPDADLNRDVARRTAKQIMALGLTTFDLNPDRLAELPKNDMRKKIIAYFIRRYTSISLDWVSQKLCMGHPSRVSRYCSELIPLTTINRYRDGACMAGRRRRAWCVDSLGYPPTCPTRFDLHTAPRHGRGPLGPHRRCRAEHVAPAMHSARCLGGAPSGTRLSTDSLW